MSTRTVDLDGSETESAPPAPTSISNIHQILDYSLTQAVVSGKTSTRTLVVSYDELAKSVGKVSTKYKDVKLVIEITTAWDEDSLESEAEEQY